MSEQAIHDILRRYGEDAKTATWKVQGNSVIYHRALERIAAIAGIHFLEPSILRAEAEEAVILVTGVLGQTDSLNTRKTEWSIGEARIGSNYRVSGKQAAYPYAMAEKRAKDRVILKLIGLHGLLYSEEEADEFKTGKPDENPEPGSITITSGKTKSAYQSRKDGDWAETCKALDLALAANFGKVFLTWPMRNGNTLRESPWVEHICEHWRGLLADYIGIECETASHVRQLKSEHIETLKALPEPFLTAAREAFAEAIESINKMEAGS